MQLIGRAQQHGVLARPDVHGLYERGLKEILALIPIRFHYKKDNPLKIESTAAHIGISAQALQRMIPEAVQTGRQGFLTVNIDPMIWAMVNAIKEQNADVVRLAARLDQLTQANARFNAENLELRTRLARLEGAVDKLVIARESARLICVARR